MRDIRKSIQRMRRRRTSPGLELVAEGPDAWQCSEVVLSHPQQVLTRSQRQMRKGAGQCTITNYGRHLVIRDRASSTVQSQAARNSNIVCGQTTRRHKAKALAASWPRTVGLSSFIITSRCRGCAVIRESALEHECWAVGLIGVPGLVRVTLRFFRRASVRIHYSTSVGPCWPTHATAVLNQSHRIDLVAPPL